MNYEIKNVTDENSLDRALGFAESIFGKHGGIGVRQQWLDRMNKHPELLLFAEFDGEVIAAVLAHREDNGNITVGVVATDERFRKQGIAKKLMLLVEERSKATGSHLIALGSAETAEEFYAKLGYTGQLLIQSEKHTIDELKALNPGYPVVYTNVYDGTINQLCLKLDKPDRKLQRLYESTLEGCYTQTMFWKVI